METIQIAIGDDEAKILEPLKLMLESLLKEKDIPYKIDCFWTDEGYDNRHIGMKRIEVYKNRQMYSYMQRDVQYLVAYSSYVEAVVKDTAYRKKTSLQVMEQELDSRCFFRIHKQYIVNLYWVRDYKKGIVHLDGKELPVSRRRQSAFERAYKEFELYYR